MAIIENNPLELKARLAAAGITLYVKNGKTVLRPATSRQPERRTRAQFVTRQRIAHNNHLWRLLRSAGDPRFEGGSSPYYRFCSLMTSCSVPFLTRDQHHNPPPFSTKPCSNKVTNTKSLRCIILYAFPRNYPIYGPKTPDPHPSNPNFAPSILTGVKKSSLFNRHTHSILRIIFKKNQKNILPV